MEYPGLHFNHIPVFPDVGSMRTDTPGVMRPFFSASSTIRKAMRSFTLPPALKNSHFASVINTIYGQSQPSTSHNPIRARLDQVVAVAELLIQVL